MLQFGVPKYGGTLSGSVVYSGSLDGNALGCREYKTPLPGGGGGMPTVLLVDRGGEGGGAGGWLVGGLQGGSWLAFRLPPALSEAAAPSCHRPRAPDCFFVEKGRYAQRYGAQAVLVADHTEVPGACSSCQPTAPCRLMLGPPAEGSPAAHRARPPVHPPPLPLLLPCASPPARRVC